MTNSTSRPARLRQTRDGRSGGLLIHSSDTSQGDTTLHPIVKPSRGSRWDLRAGMAANVTSFFRDPTVFDLLSGQIENMARLGARGD